MSSKSLNKTTHGQALHPIPPPAGIGYNGTTVEEGIIVNVWAKHFGRGVTATVLKITGNAAEIEIIKTSKRCAFRAGNRVSLGVWWLEAKGAA